MHGMYGMYICVCVCVCANAGPVSTTSFYNG